MKRTHALLLGLLSLFLTSIFLFQSAQAAFPGEGLTISPPINEPKIKPGQTAEYTIRVTNPTAELVEIYPQVMDFKAGGESGEPSFYISESDSEKFSLAKWITFDTTRIALTPEQVVEFTYTLSVPEDAEPGGHYGAVFFVSEPPTDTNPGSKVTIGSMVGSLVLLTVPGETIEKGLLENFSVSDFFVMNGNKVVFNTRISNVGNVHFKPRGNVVIKSAFGKEMGLLAFNEQGGNVLPDSTRRFTNEWSFPWYRIGMYKAELATVYGISDKPLTCVLTFWIIPWWLILVLVVLIVAVCVTWFLKNKKNKPKSRVKKNTGDSSNGPSGPIILR